MPRSERQSHRLIAAARLGMRADGRLDTPQAAWRRADEKTGGAPASKIDTSDTPAAHDRFKTESFWIRLLRGSPRTADGAPAATLRPGFCSPHSPDSVMHSDTNHGRGALASSWARARAMRR